MEKLNELVALAEKADAVANLMDGVNPHTILVVAEAFRALEQRAEENQEVIEEYNAAMCESNKAGYAGVTAAQTIRHLMERAEAAEARIKELESAAFYIKHIKKMSEAAPAADLGWILCSDKLPDNLPGKWSEPVAAVSNLGDVFQLSCMDGYWQRTKAFVESDATEVVKWMYINENKS